MLPTAALLSFVVLPSAAAAGRPGPAELPSWECPGPRAKIAEEAQAALDGYLGPAATPLCGGDLNGNGRPEILAAVTSLSCGRGIGFYRVASRVGLFEAGEDRRAAWRPLLLASDRVENSAGLIGWREPVEADGIGLRVTMTDGDRACLQLRRLDSARYRLEEPLLLVRWDPSVRRYEVGPCRGGTAGRPTGSSP
ncbi:MAG TPA: hypothetical protein VGK94_00825 [Candidatus Polarisedimenticolia bacterium]|jgi:hypothetical protein